MVNEKLVRKVYLEMVRKAQQKPNPLTEISDCDSFKRINKNVSLTYFSVENIHSDELKWIFDLERRNMERIYETCSWGWNQKAKEKEMTESGARYIIVKSSDKDNKSIGFSHFRFDMDYGDPVLYCYELQVEPEARGKGVGKLIMQILELLAWKNNMMKVTLTVQKHNKAGIRFFNALNYSLDETNPVEDFENIPYKILSKRNNNFTFDYNIY